MKLTKTHLMIAVAIILIIVGIVVYHLLYPATPRDTPIVVGGGSIYGKTHMRDSDGWKPQGNAYHASLHPGNANPNGIDYLTFTDFDSNPGSPITGTGGWAISISNPDANGIKKPNALRFCSDATCSASNTLIDGTSNPSRCPAGSFNQNGNVFLGVRNDSQLNAVLAGSVTRELDFHDPDSSCNSTTANKCDKIYDVTLETCNAAAATFTCNQKPTQCEVTVGKDH